MANVSSQDLGNQSIGKLLIKQAVPASIGILVMSLNILLKIALVSSMVINQFLLMFLISIRLLSLDQKQLTKFKQER